MLIYPGYSWDVNLVKDKLPITYIHPIVHFWNKKDTGDNIFLHTITKYVDK